MYRSIHSGPGRAAKGGGSTGRPRLRFKAARSSSSDPISADGPVTRDKAVKARRRSSGGRGPSSARAGQPVRLLRQPELQFFAVSSAQGSHVAAGPPVLAVEHPVSGQVANGRGPGVLLHVVPATRRPEPVNSRFDAVQDRRPLGFGLFSSHRLDGPLDKQREQRRDHSEDQGGDQCSSFPPQMAKQPGVARFPDVAGRPALPPGIEVASQVRPAAIAGDRVGIHPTPEDGTKACRNGVPFRQGLRELIRPMVRVWGDRARKQLDQDQTQRIQVGQEPVVLGSRVRILIRSAQSAEAFGGHVSDRAAGLGSLAVHDPVNSQVEVEQRRMTVRREEDVGRFDVAVRNAASMGMIQGLGEPGADPGRRLRESQGAEQLTRRACQARAGMFRGRAAVQRLEEVVPRLPSSNRPQDDIERRAPQERHAEDEQASLLIAPTRGTRKGHALQDLHDMGMTGLPHELRLGRATRAHLQGDKAVAQVMLLRQEDARERAAPELAEQEVGTDLVAGPDRVQGCSGLVCPGHRPVHGRRHTVGARLAGRDRIDVRFVGEHGSRILFRVQDNKPAIPPKPAVRRCE